MLLLRQLTLEEILRRTGRERQGRKPQECCCISRLSDAVFHCQDKQENSRVSWRSNHIDFKTSDGSAEKRYQSEKGGIKYGYVLILFEKGGCMHTSKKQRQASVKLKGDISSMLKNAKKYLPHRTYCELCTAVNNAADYTTKKGLILACFQAKKNNF